MSDWKKVILSSIGVLSLVSLVVAAAAIRLLYGAAFDQERYRLVDVVKSQARIIESIAMFNGERLGGSPAGSQAGAVAQIRDAYSRHATFGKSGEVALARREGLGKASRTHLLERG